MSSLDNKKIAKNTLALYVRMFLMTVISLYTSRVILDTLGFEDYGIYNVVGGIVMMFSFLNSSMSIAIQRCLSYEIGKRNDDRLNRLFCVAINIHVVMAMLIAFIAGMIGTLLISKYLNVELVKLSDVYWVFAYSILSCCATIIRIPYNACLISYERFSFFAYISILEALINLGIAVVLPMFGNNRLIWFSLLIAIISWVNTTIYVLYCRRSFSIACYSCIWDKTIFKDLFSFAGWSSLGEIAWIATNYGVNIVLNVFGGVVVNTARGISYQVAGALKKLVDSFQSAVNPQIIKLYAEGNKEQMFGLLIRGNRLSVYLLLLFAIPMMLEMNTILSLWLKDFPPYSVIFCRLAVFNTVLDTLSNLLATAAKAYGKIRNYQIVVSIILLCNFPLSLIAMKIGLPYESTFWVYAFISILLVLVRLIMLRMMILLPVRKTLKGMLPVIPVAVVSAVLPYIFHNNMECGISRLFTVTSIACLTTVLTIYIIGLDKSEHNFVNEKIKLYLKRLF